MTGPRMTPEQLDQIQARNFAATKRRQAFEAASRRFSDGFGADGSMSFYIDATKNDVPGLLEDNDTLLALVREQQAKLDKVAEVIRDVSFDYDVDTPTVVEVDAIRTALTATEGA